jgi:hypothetical protein
MRRRKQSSPLSHAELRKFNVGQTRGAFIQKYLMDLPRSYSDRLPFMDDEEELRKAAAIIRQQFAADQALEAGGGGQGDSR